MPGGRSLAEISIRTTAIAGGVVFVASLAGGVLAYVFLFAVVGSPASASDRLRDVAVNVSLFTVFALHHSLLARSGAKRLITSLTLPRLERSLYVWVASALFLWVCVAWRPVPGVLWTIGAPAAFLLNGIQIAGVVMSIGAARRLDVLALAGIRQAFEQPSRAPAGLLRTGLYGVVRHPIYLAWVLMVWPTPAMTGSRLLFAALSTAYLVIAIPFEERSLKREFGEYNAYAKQVRWRMIPFVY